MDSLVTALCWGMLLLDLVFPLLQSMLVSISQWALLYVHLCFELELKLSVLKKTLTTQTRQVEDVVPPRVPLLYTVALGTGFSKSAPAQLATSTSLVFCYQRYKFRARRREGSLVEVCVTFAGHITTREGPLCVRFTHLHFNCCSISPSSKQREKGEDLLCLVRQEDCQESKTILGYIVREVSV